MRHLASTVARGTLVALLVAPLAATGCAGPGKASEALAPLGGAGSFVGGYHAWWSGDAWTAYPLSGLDRLYIFELELSPTGALGDPHGWPTRWTSLAAAARTAGVSVVPVITLYPDAAVEALLAEEEAVERAAASIAGLVAEHSLLDGVHLDLEVFRPISPEARRGYVELARAVRGSLDLIRPGSVLSVFIPALDLDDAYDEAGLAGVADYLVVQGYDLHHRTGDRAGPVAPVAGWGALGWDAVIGRLLSLGLDPATLVMGTPLYGTRWPTEGPEPGSPTRGPGITIPLVAPADVLPELPRARSEAEEHGLRRDPASSSPYYVFQDGEGWVQGWFEDAESLRAKREFVRRRGLGGLAYFPLAYAPEDLRTELEGRR